MLNPADVLAKVQTQSHPSSWRITRTSGRAFVASGLVLLFAWFAFVNDASSKESTVAKYIPIPSLTWDVPTGSGFILSVVVLLVVFVGLLWQYGQRRREALIFTPEGFIQANLRTGSIKRAVDYSTQGGLALHQAGEAEFEIVPRIHLGLIDKQDHESPWNVENFYALPPAEITRTVFDDYCHFITPPVPPATPEEESPPEQLAKMALAGQRPDNWRVSVPHLSLRAYLGPLVVFGVGIALVGGFINSYFISGPSLPDRFNTGRPFGDVLAAELVTLIGVPLLLAFISGLLYVFVRKARMARMIFIITQTRWIVAWRKSGKVVQMLRFADVDAIKLTYWYKSFTLFYRTPDGKRHTIVMAADSLKSPAFVTQSFLWRYYRCRARLGKS